MRSRLPSWILLLYLAIDLANPFVPGAFAFTSEDGLVWVEAMSPARPRLTVGTAEAIEPAPALLLPADSDCRRSGEPTRVPDLAAWLAGVRTGDHPARDLPPPDSDDH
jgi:hypothetical protein